MYLVFTGENYVQSCKKSKLEFKKITLGKYDIGTIIMRMSMNRYVVLLYRNTLDIVQNLRHSFESNLFIFIVK